MSASSGDSRDLESPGQMTVKILSGRIRVAAVYVLWSGLEGRIVESGLRVSADCSVGCGYGVRHSGTLAGG